MDVLSLLLQGFATAATPVNLLWCFVGCALGTAVGVLPGIGPAVAVAMLLPITVKVEATASMIFFAGIYYGAMYGGSTTSILLNTPGETASMVTAMEGNKMAKSGRAGAALATAAIGSFVAGTIATVLVTLFAPIVAELAVKLGPPEYFMLMVLAFILSLCSTSDAFIAATLDKFSWGAKLAFLTFGPMMDVKLLFLYQTVLRKRFIVMLALGLFIAIGGISIFWQQLLFEAR